MRAIGQIEHPVYKITVFKNDGRTSVKFETALYEQTYKLGDDERLSSVEAIQNWIDAAFLAQVSDAFRQMHQTRLEAIARSFPLQTQAVFEEII